MKYSSSIYKNLIVPDNEHGKIIRDLTKTSKSDLVTFNGSTKTPIYSWFYYKQGFSSELLPWILATYGKEREEKIYDPFCGVGTTLLAAREHGINSVGVDISPLCVFVSKAKTNSSYDVRLIASARDKLLKTEYHAPNIQYPDIKIVERAIPHTIKNRILFLKEEIANINDVDSRMFFQMALLSIMQDVILAKRDGAFLRILEKREVPDPLDRFRTKTYEMLQDLRIEQKQLNRSAVSEEAQKRSRVSVYEADAREFDLEEKSISKVVTSPPYLNRYDYTRIYSPELGLYFVDSFDALKKLRQKTIRSHVEAQYLHSSHAESETLETASEQLQERADKGEINKLSIPQMIKGYFEDAYIYLRRISRTLTDNGLVALAVGNSRWSGVAVETDFIICEIAKQLGLVPLEINVCKIRGTSAQQVKKYGEEQIREGIVVLRKNT